MAKAKHASFGGQRVAMKKAGTLSYRLTDRLGSTSVVTNQGGGVVAQQIYKPWGESRWASGTLPTDRKFTGQRSEEATLGSLYDYGARAYSPRLGRFLSPDSIVPQPGDPQSLNRYSYVGNRPLNLTDPSGLAPQYPGDPDPNNAPCATDWCWQNRWYRAHSYDWDSGHWGQEAAPHFYDEGIAQDVLSEAGVKLTSSKGWQLEQKYSVARAVALLGRKLGGGLAQLQRLLGGGTTTVWLGTWSPVECGFHQSPCAPPPPWDTGSNVWLTEKALANYGTNAHMLVVHELAHVIDWHSNVGGRSFSQAWPYPPITGYAQTGWPPPWDRFAEAVAVYVLGTDYERVAGSLKIVDLSVQMSRIHDLLQGWR